MSGHRSGSRRMSARFVTGSSGGRADSARLCVPKWRFRVSAIRRGSAEHPRDNSPRPFAESDRERLNRCAVVQAVASNGASIDVRLRDANDRRWLDQHQPFPPLGPEPPQKQPKQPVSWVKALIRTSEDAELVAQGKSLEQEVSTRCPSRSDRSTRPDDGSHRLEECRPATPTSMIFARAQYWRGTGRRSPTRSDAPTCGVVVVSQFARGVDIDLIARAAAARAEPCTLKTEHSIRRKLKSPRVSRSSQFPSDGMRRNRRELSSNLCSGLQTEREG